MRIVYDGSVYAMQPVGGINRYFAHLIGRLPSDVVPVLTLSVEAMLHLPAHANLELRRAEFPGLPRFARRWLVRRHFHHVLSQEQADVLHPTYYTGLSGREFRQYKAPLVVTVYDMIHERFPDLLDPSGRAAEAKRRAVTQARAVICISRRTKEDLLALCPVPEQKVHVIHLASDMEPPAREAGAALDSADGLADFLYVGSRTGYKNFQCLLAAWQLLVCRIPDARLHVVGPAFSRDEHQEIGARRIERTIVAHGHVSDAQLGRLYQQSCALVYPSRYEGFGIPLLEAMRCGTVVVAADRSSIPEVVGDAGILFDPDSPGELADILAELVEHPDRRQPWLAKGRRRASEFSWDRTVAETMAVYRQAAA